MQRIRNFCKEFQTKAQSYQGDAQNQTELINQQRQVELQEMQQRIQNSEKLQPKNFKSDRRNDETIV